MDSPIFPVEGSRARIREGRFASTDLDAADRLHRWATSARVIETVSERPRVIHGDLTAEQVFVTPDGYRVIDWQRPVLGPPEVDLVTPLVGAVTARGLAGDPLRHVHAAVGGVVGFLLHVWHDLRRKHLLPVAMLLVSALVAVPIVMKKSSNSAPAAVAVKIGATS